MTLIIAGPAGSKHIGSTTLEAVNGRLHAAMPRLGHMLAPDNVEHLIAYIRSLQAR